MPKIRIVLAVSLLLASASVVTGQVFPNPYRQDFKSGGLGPADPWAKLLAGRTMGAVVDLKTVTSSWPTAMATSATIAW